MCNTVFHHVFNNGLENIFGFPPPPTCRIFFSLHTHLFFPETHPRFSDETDTSPRGQYLCPHTDGWIYTKTDRPCLGIVMSASPPKVPVKSQKGFDNPRR